MPSNDYAVLILGGDLTIPMDSLKGHTIACADSGAEHARRLGLDVKAIIGDLDSITQETLEFYRSQGTKIIPISSQEDNDFEKALRHLLEKNVRNLLVFGMTGRRADHTLTNFSVMLRYTDLYERLLAIDAQGEHQFITPQRRTLLLDLPLGTTISLTPYGSAAGIHTINLQYPLKGETLELGRREGLSNRVTGSPIEITIESGALLVSVLRSADQ